MTPFAATRMTPFVATRMVASKMTPEFFAIYRSSEISGVKNDAKNGGVENDSRILRYIYRSPRYQATRMKPEESENGNKSCLRTYMILSLASILGILFNLWLFIPFDFRVHILHTFFINFCCHTAYTLNHYHYQDIDQFQLWQQFHQSFLPLWLENTCLFG